MVDYAGWKFDLPQKVRQNSPVGGGKRTFLTGANHRFNEKFVHAPVIGEFRMKGGGQQIPLTHQHRKSFAAGENLKPSTDVRKAGSTYEHHFKRAAGKRGGFNEDGGIDLPSIGVAFDDRIKQPERALRRVQNFFGEQDGARAGAKHRPDICEFFERLEQSASLEEFQHRRRLAARKNESIQRLAVQAKVLRIFHQGRNGPRFGERLSMSAVIALYGDDTNVGTPCLQSRFLCVHYHPRVCSSCDSSMAAAASPFIVPVTCALTSARILGSL